MIAILPSRIRTRPAAANLPECYADANRWPASSIKRVIKEKKMKYTKFFLLVVLFLASCAAPATSAPASTQTLTPEPTATQTSIPTPTITPAPTQVGGGSGRFIFTYKKEEFLEAFPDLKGETNVFIANIDGTNSAPITNGLEGRNYLKDISPDGTKVLITSTSNLQNKDAVLYMVNLDSLNSEPIKLADGLPNYYGGNSAAKWMDNSQIVYIGQGEAGFGIYKINTDGTNPTNIYKYNNDDEGNKPFEFLAIDGTRIYWDTQITTRLSSNSVNNKYFVWWSSLNGGENTPLEFNGKQIFFEDVPEPDLVFSPDGTKIAWVEKATGPESPNNYLKIASVSDINNPYTTQVLTSQLILRWFPDGTKILVFDLFSVDTPIEKYSQYYQQHPEKPLASSFKNLYGVYEVPIASNLPIRNYNFAADIMGSLKSFVFMDLYDISPDGRQIILSTYEKNNKGSYNAILKLFNLETLVFSDVSGFTFTNTAISGVHWIP
jgi:hypothetical protein